MTKEEAKYIYKMGKEMQQHFYSLRALYSQVSQEERHLTGRTSHAVEKMSCTIPTLSDALVMFLGGLEDEYGPEVAH